MRVRTVVFCLLVSTMAAGCGRGVKTGGVTTGGDDDDAAGDDDDGVGATPTPTSPGEAPSQDVNIPATIGATIGLSRLHSNTGTDDFEGAAWFLPQPLPTGGVGFQDLFHYYDSVPLDTCQNVVPDNTGTDFAGRDAGESIVATGPAGALSLPKIPFGSAIFYGGSGAASVFVPNADYVVSASGGPDIGAFTTTVGASGEITSMISPDMWSPLPLVIDRSVPLALEWTSVADGRDVFVWLTQEGQIQSPFMAADKILVCRFADDGHAGIPADWLAWFRESEPSAQDARLIVRKYKWWTFTAPGGGAVLATIDSTWDAIAAFE